MTVKMAEASDDADDAGDHRRGRRLSHGGGTAAALHAAETARQGHQHAVDAALDQALRAGAERQRGARLMEIFHRGNPQHGDADEPPAQNPQEVAIQRQQRHHRHQRQHARHHQEFHGREAEGGQGIDFFVHRHGAQLSRKGGPGPAGHDDGGHHRPHLQHHRHADQIGHIDLRPEHGQLDGPDEGQDGPDQKADQGDDRQGLGAALLDEQDELDPAEARPAAQEVPPGRTRPRR